MKKSSNNNMGGMETGGADETGEEAAVKDGSKLEEWE